MAVRWFPELLRVRTATGAEEAPAPAAKPEAKAEPKDGACKVEDLGLIRGLDLPRGLEKPVLVYFHWPHEDGDRGRRVVKFCNGPLDDEAFVRVTPLFHCVEVNTRDSDANLVEESRVRATPTLLVCRPDGSVVWRSEDTGITGKVLAGVLKKVLKDRLPEAWAGIEKEMAAQKASVAEARRLFAEGKTEDAMMAVNLVVNSDVRFTDEWAESVKVLREQERKAKDESKK